MSATTSDAAPLSAGRGPPAVGFSGATGWLNSPPLAADGLRGSVVLVDFWTVHLHQLAAHVSAYVRAWAEKYKDQGLVVIGVHTPAACTFERDLDNVRTAARTTCGVGYPIALDSDYAVWDAFGNHYWPAVYIADTQGRIRHHQFGEGGVRRVRTGHPAVAARKRRWRRIADDLVAVAPDGFEAQADWTRLESPETYLGYRANSEPCVSRWCQARRASHLCRTRRVGGSTSGHSLATGRLSVARAC